MRRALGEESEYDTYLDDKVDAFFFADAATSEEDMGAKGEGEVSAKVASAISRGAKGPWENCDVPGEGRVPEGARKGRQRANARARGRTRIARGDKESEGNGFFFFLFFFFFFPTQKNSRGLY